MDTSDMYIEKCKKAYHIQSEKLIAGFEEGDYVFDGKKVRIVGHDFIQLEQKYNAYKNQRVFEFAMLSSIDSCVEYKTEFPSTVDIKNGSYIVERLYNPIWVMRQDQIQDLLLQHYKPSSPLISSVTDDMLYFFRREVCEEPDTMEQMWLTYMMWIRGDRLWNVYQWE